MGVLCAVSAAIQTARLNAAVTNLGVQNELDVIAAAVIGGTSFSGGIGTIPGAVLGAVVMQSLRSGMVLLQLDSPSQDIVVGIVLVAAVGLDSRCARAAGSRVTRRRRMTDRPSLTRHADDRRDRPAARPARRDAQHPRRRSAACTPSTTSASTSTPARSSASSAATAPASRR